MGEWIGFSFSHPVASALIAAAMPRHSPSSQNNARSGATASGTSSFISPFWMWLLVFASVLLAYAPALSAGLIWDDAGHITRPDLRSLAGLGRIWFERGATQQYYPLLHSAFWFEHHLWGDAPLGYHLLNVLLHAANACLFATLLRRLAIPGAWFAAFLFALHPVCVESVAWISEQKNTLSTLFYFSAALVYVRFDTARASASAFTQPFSRRPARSPHTFSVRLYALATTLFICALLTKTVTATLPAALLVIFWWQRRRLDWRRDVVPLLPWLALGATAGWFTAKFERDLIGASGSDFNFSLADRLLIAGRAFWFYLGKLVWPADLIFIYPRWTLDPAQLWQWAFPIAGAALLGVAVFAAYIRTYGRSALTALLLFAGALFPVLGFFNIYPFQFSFVADHFQYLASLAVFALVGAAIAQIATTLSIAARTAAIAPLFLLLGFLSWKQSTIYRDVFTLYETTLARNPACWMAHNNLAIALADTGRIPEAIPHLETTLALKPDFAQAENNLGDDLVRLGRAPEAIPHFERALHLQPNYAVAQRNLGMALAMTDRAEEAVAHFARAAEIQPSDAEAELDWAVALAQTSHFPAAAPHFERALALAPNYIDAHVAYGHAFAAHQQLDDAVAQFRAALELDPRSADAQLGLAYALRSLGRNEEAQKHFLAAKALGASSP